MTDEWVTRGQARIAARRERDQRQAEIIAEAARRVVATAPPLTIAQAARLRVIFAQEVS